MSVNLNALDDMGSLLCTSAGGAAQGFSYTPFGSTPARSGNHSLLPGFNGERLDPVSQTYHLGNGYRTYNPVLMRFNAPDSWSPFGAGGLNQYAYCEGDPINRADPSGHMSWQAGVGIGLGILGILGAVFTFGQSLAAAAAAEAAMTASMAADVIAAGLGVAASVTSIASAATEESNPEASQILGWISFGLGIASAVTGVANAGKTIHAKFKQKNEFRNAMSQAFEQVEMLGINADAGPSSDAGQPRRGHARALSLTSDVSCMNKEMYENADHLRFFKMLNYFDDEDRAAAEVHVNDGRIKFKKSGAFPSNGGYIYAYSTEGKLYMGGGANKHSEFLFGMGVKSAGHLKIKNGLIVQIDSCSGHYTPPSSQFISAMNDAFSRGYITSNTKLLPFDKLGGYAGQILNKWATLV